MNMSLGPYAAFIVGAYLAAVAIVLGLILWVILDRRHLARRLGDLELQGITRRSGQQTEGNW
jgi:heme exporter protein CcmD